MKLTVNNQLVHLPSDASITIKRKNPILNDDTGAFSYPFAVPYDNNSVLLGNPGRLQRRGNIPTQEFSLFDIGILVLSGEVSYDETVPGKEIGMILKSGQTIFNEKMKGLKLSDLNFGSEAYPYVKYNDFFLDDLADWISAYGSTYSDPLDQLETQWRAHNEALDNIALAPFIAQKDGAECLVNRVNSQGDLWLRHVGGGYNVDFFCFQFRLSWVITKVYENAGYRVDWNAVEFDQFILGKIITVSQFYATVGPDSYAVVGSPATTELKYANLMPDYDVLNFIDEMKGAFGISVNIDERSKLVTISQKFSMFSSSKKVVLGNVMDGKPTVSEELIDEGYTIAYADQDDENATNGDDEILKSVDTYDDLPAYDERYEEKVMRVTETNYDYKLTEDGTDNWVWRQTNRLPKLVEGSGKYELEIKMKVPINEPRDIAEFSENNGGKVDVTIMKTSIDKSKEYNDQGLYISILRGWHARGSYRFLYLMANGMLTDGSATLGFGITPAELKLFFFREFITWQAYLSRKCKADLLLPLRTVIAIQNDKRYLINGIWFIFDEFDIKFPYRGRITANMLTA